MGKKMPGATDSQITSDKPAKGRKFLGFLITLGLSSTFLFLHYKGIKVWEISPDKSLARLLAVAFLTVLFFRVSEFQ